MMNRAAVVGLALFLLLISDSNKHEPDIHDNCQGFDFSDTIDNAFLRDSTSQPLQVHLPKPYLRTPDTEVFYARDGDGELVANVDRETLQPSPPEYVIDENLYDRHLMLLVSRHRPLQQILEDTLRGNGENWRDTHKSWDKIGLVLYDDRNISPFLTYANSGDVLTDLLTCDKGRTGTGRRVCNLLTNIGGFDVQITFSATRMDLWQENKSIIGKFIECIRR